jgi:signal transduction histidine kinase
MNNLKLTFLGAFLIFITNHSALANYLLESDSKRFELELYNSDNEDFKLILELLENGETAEALEKLYLLIEEAARLDNNKLVIEGKLLLADVYRENGDYKKSNEIFYEIIPSISTDFEKLQYVFFKKGGNFQFENQIDSAKVNYEKAISYSENVEKHEDLKAKMYANLAGIYYLKADYEKAIENFKIAAEYQKILGNKEIEAGILNNLGGVYFMQEKYNDALNNFQKAFNLVGYGQSDLEKQTRNNSYINIAYAYSALKNHEKAFEYQDKFFSLNDSLQQELKYKEIAEIESKYNVATKEKLAEIEKVKRKDAEVLAYGLGLAILLLLLGIYSLYKVYKLNKKNYKLQINQKQLIHKSKIEKLKSDSQAKILVATLDGGLEERKKIAMVLHDNVSALLSAANLHLYASKKQLKNNVPIEIDKTQKIILEASEKIRDLSHKLISSVLLKFGLSMAVHDLCEKSSNSTIQLKSDSKNIGRFDQNFEIKMFNIINELVNNILKHSKAKSGVIKLEQLNGQLQVVVFDDGNGFNINEIEEKSGIGLRQVDARINALNGLINISPTASGTRIYISVPIVY